MSTDRISLSSLKDKSGGLVRIAEQRSEAQSQLRGGLGMTRQQRATGQKPGSVRQDATQLESSMSEYMKDNRTAPTQIASLEANLTDASHLISNIAKLSSMSNLHNLEDRLVELVQSFLKNIILGVKMKLIQESPFNNDDRSPGSSKFYNLLNRIFEPVKAFVWKPRLKKRSKQT